MVIVSLPNDLNIFGDELIRILTEKIQEDFEEKLFRIIECEVAEDAVIKTPKIKQCIKEGTKYKMQLRQMIETTTNEYFSRMVKMEADTESIKKQKALSYMALKGYDISHLEGPEQEPTFSDIKLFDPSKKADTELSVKKQFEITDINIIEDSQELEIMVRNNTGHEMDDVSIKITHVKEFFEKEVLNLTVDKWYPDEELLFISPIIPHIDEYLFFIIEEDYEGHYQKLLAKKIDINTVSKIKS
ncbi:MAG: hypothetical protein EU544_04430 [Promethearchaeota archaeon]|nr:MAG: hypothetical protein EU544_04430 [Candidatus Lokiarchaeota archaeon]